MKVINIIDPKGRNTILYGINIKDGKSLSNIRLEKLQVDLKEEDDKTRKTFYVQSDKVNQIIMLSIMDSQVFVNVARLDKDILKLASVSTKVSFIKTNETKYIEIYYNPTSERKIFIIDLETGDEIVPELNLTSAGIMKGIINLKLDKKYLVLELRDDSTRTMTVGLCNLFLKEDILKLSISKEEIKRINIDKYMELIDSGKCIEQKLMDVRPEKEIIL